MPSRKTASVVIILYKAQFVNGKIVDKYDISQSDYTNITNRVFGSFTSKIKVDKRYLLFYNKLIVYKEGYYKDE